jgi:hypothetical protein
MNQIRGSGLGLARQCCQTPEADASMSVFGEKCSVALQGAGDRCAMHPGQCVELCRQRATARETSPLRKAVQAPREAPERPMTRLRPLRLAS